MEAITKISLVAIGGASGAVARYGINFLFGKAFAPFPSATFFINVSGSFLIGFVLAFVGDRYELSENLKLALVIGFLGAYTTFSTFEFETYVLIRDKQLAMAVFYASLSFAIGLISVFAGVFVGKRFE